MTLLIATKKYAYYIFSAIVLIKNTFYGWLGIQEPIKNDRTFFSVYFISE